MPSREILDRAKAMSKTAVVFIGRTSSEAHDNLPEKGQYYLTDEERFLMSSLRKEFEKVVAVLNIAYPIETEWLVDVDVALLVGLPGMMGGRALAELLEGKVNPSGRLTTTWAKDYQDYPSSRNFLTYPELFTKYPESRFVTTVYEEGMYVGYRYFDTFGKTPAFRFGHGLSYTTFTQAGTVEDRMVRVTVTNIGKVPGKEVVQIYVQLPEDKLEQPVRRLAAFGKTKELSPGEQQTLCLNITDSALKSFDPDRGAWVMEAGEIKIFLGNTKIGAICIPETIILKRTETRIPAPIPVKELSRYDREGTWPEGKDTCGHTGDELPYTSSQNYIQEPRELPKPGCLITFPEVVRKPSLLEDFVAQMTDYELARLSVGGATGWGVQDEGFAGQLFNTGELEKYQIPVFRFADGNNGVNLTEPSIGFPVSSNMCASWNEELLYKEGLAVGIEAKDRGISCILAPALNLHRNILCGRNTEYFSEDPLLAGRMAGQQCRGLEEAGVAGCIKHFFANNAETRRNQNHSIMSERTARELYLAAFEYAFETHMPDTVMISYNASNGMYCSDNPVLLRGILRDEMEFSGFVMTDWDGYGNCGMEGLLAGGVNWIAPGSIDDTLVTPVVEALDSGKLSSASIQQGAVNLIRVIIKYCK